VAEVKYPKVALAMILSCDDVADFKKCIKSIGKHVDGIFVNLNHPKMVPLKVLNEVNEILKSYNHDVMTSKWRGNFVQTRQESFDLVPKEYDFIFWCDADDIIKHPEKIKETASITPKSVSGIFARYDYAHDEYGNVTVPHYVARLVRNDGIFHWKSSFDDAEYTVHETLVESRNTGKRVSEEFWVDHQDSAERSIKSLYRNVELLQKMYKKAEKGLKIDPRILFYLGTHLYDAGELTEAKYHLQNYMTTSGWPDERSEALVYLGLIHLVEEKPQQAKHAFVLAISESPNNPRPYTEIADLSFKGKRYSEAADWALKAIECKKKPTSMATRPMDHTFRPYMIYAKALGEMGGARLEEAMKYVNKALKLRPADPEAKALQENLENYIELRDMNRAFARLASAVRDDKPKALALLDSIPKRLVDSPIVAEFRNLIIPPKEWPRKSIVIFCGASVFDLWGPSALKQGIGGSEEAVIRLKLELEKLGWDVHVFATPGKEADDTWHNYWEFNPKDSFDVLIAWRSPWFYDNEYDARQKYLWMHDVMPQNEFTQERLDNLDKVIVLSKYHRSLFPNIPDDKIFLSTNGITPEDFEGIKEKRNPKRIIWMSSHVRGLQLLYDMWPDIKKAVPDAILDIYYGWESYINVNKDNPERMIWMEEMVRQGKELKDVEDHGKISQPQIVREIFRSGIWAYPCPFPEISCITALKAQAGGAIPVSSNFAALDETVQFGIKVPMSQMAEDTPVGKWNKQEIERYKQALIEMLQKPALQEKIRPEMMRWGREQSWAKVAEQWNEQMQV